MISVKPDWSLPEESVDDEILNSAPIERAPAPNPRQLMSTERNPYDCKTWGPACGRGIAYMQIGAEVASGTKGVIRKITGGRKGKGK